MKEILHDARNITVNGLYAKNIGPYTGVQYYVKVSFKNGKKFRLATYQAYNALGLIGSECNGIVVLDEVEQRVVCDELAKQDSGWFGASTKQFNIIDALVKMPWKEFRAFINKNERLRYCI